VVAQRQASVASKGTGRLELLGAAVGDRVTAGQLVARLERKDMDAALEQARARLGIAKAALANAEAERQDADLGFNRARALLAKQFVTQAEFDTAAARLRRAEATVRSAKAGIQAAAAEVQTAEVELENTNIRAPFDGTVLKKFAEVGEVVAPLAASTSSKGAVLLIADLSTMQVEAEVSESVIGTIRDHQSVEILLDAVPGHRYQGEVAQILPTADRSKATVPVKIRFLNLDDRVRPEMSAKVTFVGGPKPE
jgi:RND family efflux transporter MFP subunit